MRALALIACSFFLLTAQVQAGPFDGSDDYKVHLEFLGYSVDEGETSLLAKHTENLNVLVRSFNGGVLMVTFFGTTDAAKQDLSGLQAFLNDMNSNAVAGRYYIDGDGDLVIEGWYPGDYERSRFGLFLDKFNLVGGQLADAEAAGRYLE